MYVKCGDVKSARLLFDRMPRRDIISWNAMISGYFENGRCHEGLELFFNMRGLSVDPNFMTMTCVISACELLGDGRLGRDIHAYVISTGFAVDISVCNSLAQMYLNAGSWREAEKVFTRMECKDIVSWTTMISGYKYNFLPEKAIDTYTHILCDFCRDLQEVVWLEKHQLILLLALVGSTVSIGASSVTTVNKIPNPLYNLDHPKSMCLVLNALKIQASVKTRLERVENGTNVFHQMIYCSSVHG